MSATSSPLYVKKDGPATEPPLIAPAIADEDEDLEEIITLTDEELAKIEVAARELMNDKRTERPLTYLMFLYAREVGLRIGELLELQHKDIKEDGLHVRRFYAYTEDSRDPETGEKIYKIKKWLKNYKISRTIPLTDEALAILDEVDRVKKELGIESDHLFSADEHPVDYSHANRCMKKLCRQAGLPDAEAISAALRNGSVTKKSQEIA